MRRRQPLPRECINEQRVLLQVLLDGVFLRENPRTVRLALLHRRGVRGRRRQVVVHDVRVGGTEEHQAAAVVVADDVRLPAVFAVFHVVHLLVGVVVEGEVGRARRGHRTAVPMVVRRVYRVVLPRTETQYRAHVFQYF